MTHFAGLDGSLEENATRVVDDTGRIIKETRAASELSDLIAALTALGLPLERVGLEACSLTAWLHNELRAAGLPAICIETRSGTASMKTIPNKTDRNDAQALAQIMRTRWYRQVHVKSRQARLWRSLLVAQGTAPAYSLRPGQVERTSHDYRRHGTLDLFAALDVKAGTVIGRCEGHHRSGEFRAFLDQVEESVASELEVHLVLDDLKTHKTTLVHDWLVQHPRSQLRFTPTSCVYTWSLCEGRGSAESRASPIVVVGREAVDCPGDLPRRRDGEFGGASWPRREPWSPQSRRRRSSRPQSIALFRRGCASSTAFWARRRWKPRSSRRPLRSRLAQKKRRRALSWPKDGSR